MNTMNEKIKAVIFDMDGTILDTERVWKKVSTEILKQNGVVLTDDEYKRIMETVSGHSIFDTSLAFKNKFGLKISVNEMAEQKIALANQYFQEHIEFIKGFEQFHERLQFYNIPTGVATNAHPENLKGLADKMEFQKFFGSNVYCIADVDFRGKPDPALFLHTAAKLGVSPEECVIFEDSIAGFQAAKSAGIKCIAIKNSANKNLLDIVDGAIDDYLEAEDAIYKLNL